ncbi:uncharacterized protein LOC135841187 [Planococcus citri]|uniref:uncharacterized protein LOC135841187 n=1 Tax=Planococcus citri TaxID=170843 RepID=UPI0031F8B102
MLSKVVAILSTVLALSNALNSVQVVNTNANMQSQSQNQYPYGSGGYWSRPNNQVYLSGAVRSYQGGYPSYDQGYYPSNIGYRYRRQVPVTPIVKEANAQYQYQGSNQYDERINPMYNSNYGGDFNTPYPYSDAYRYKENNQYQLQGNAQSRVEGDPRFGDQFNNRYQSQQQGSLHRQRYQY